VSQILTLVGRLSYLSQRTRAGLGPSVRWRSREDRSMLQLLALAGVALFAVVALASIAAAALSVFIFPG
jgi:hypothetical protein